MLIEHNRPANERQERTRSSTFPYSLSGRFERHEDIGVPTRHTFNLVETDGSACLCKLRDLLTPMSFAVYLVMA